MALTPVAPPFTPRELALGEYVAVGLWLMSATLLATLVVWAV